MDLTRGHLFILENAQPPQLNHKKHYLAVELHPESRQHLLGAVPPKESGKTHASHITLSFSPSKEEFDDFMRNHHGKPTEINVTHEAHSPEIGAHAVRVGGFEKWPKSHKHITISTREGVGPKFSNDVLASQEGHKLDKPLKLTGTFKALPK